LGTKYATYEGEIPAPGARDCCLVPVKVFRGREAKLGRRECEGVSQKRTGQTDFTEGVNANHSSIILVYQSEKKKTQASGRKKQKHVIWNSDNGSFGNAADGRTSDLKERQKRH